MTKLQKFTLLQLREINYGINSMMIGHNEFSNGVVPSDETQHCVTVVLSLQQDILDEIRLRISECDIEAIDKAYQKKLLNTQQ